MCQINVNIKNLIKQKYKAEFIDFIFKSLLIKIRKQGNPEKIK